MCSTRKGNWLDPKNCNKAKCMTCIFGDKPLEIAPERMNEIRGYLVRMESSHLCHTTNLTCFGALEYQAQIMHRMGVIKEESVKCFLDTAAQYLNNQSTKD
jgi:hypothetical protein